MAEYEQQKKIQYRKIGCPHCGNEILAKSVEENQKCFHCKRMYKINYIKHGKKFHWEPIAIDYSYAAEGRPSMGAKFERGANNELKY